MLCNKGPDRSSGRQSLHPLELVPIFKSYPASAFEQELRSVSSMTFSISTLGWETPLVCPDVVPPLPFKQNQVPSNLRSEPYNADLFRASPPHVKRNSHFGRRLCLNHSMTNAIPGRRHEVIFAPWLNVAHWPPKLDQMG